MSRRRLVWIAIVASLSVAGPLLANRLDSRFDHWQHRRLFPSCMSCHAGVQDTAASLWPAPSACLACHDGAVGRRVEWQPPAPARTNLDFTHGRHAAALAAARPDSLLQCRACHSEPGADRMQVRLAVATNCLACHGIRAPHFEAPDTACATCHVPLAQALRLTAADIADFPKPASHTAPDFVLARHGRLAREGPGGIAASCATCHAQSTCIACHVNAPEVAAIQALAPDPRVQAVVPSLPVPRSHTDPDFLREHVPPARDAARNCATCHTQESCLVCHVAEPRVARALPAASPARGRGAMTQRRRPPNHGADFSETHAAPAAARPASCASCHTRSECLDCHQPNAASATPGYHPAGFLVTHPVAAYQRQTACADCHNTAQFCVTCHVTAGLAANRPLDAGFHDAKRFFLVGHGQAARQNLESCTACHAEQDCMTCHASSIVGGRGFNPHGPGFDATRLRRRNPQTCTACHGAAIPGGP